MNTLINNYDAIERLIFDEELRIEAIDVHPDLDIMLIILNTKAVIQQHLSRYYRLKSADKTALLKYELIADGTGIHWPDLDEDLSLKGFLRDKLNEVVNNETRFTPVGK